jgi:hypothetical protein
METDPDKERILDSEAKTSEIIRKDEPCDFCGKHTLTESMQWEYFNHAAGATDIIAHVVLKAYVPVISCESCEEAWTDYRGEEIREAVGLKHVERVAAAEQARVAVKRLDESKTVGWTDDKGRYCLPLSVGYYIKFPIKDDPTQLFMAWHHNDPVGGSSDYKETKRIAQDHHRRRILESVDLVAEASE